MAFIDDIKTTLRISNTAYNTEITDLINACKVDLGLSGILSENVIETDMMIKMAIINYCKANFGWNNPDSDKYKDAYESIKNHISLSQDYAFFEVVITVKSSSGLAIRNAEVTFNDETKTTNTLGIANFYTRAGNNFKYAVSAENYYADDDELNLLDISASTTLNITLTGV